MKILDLIVRLAVVGRARTAPNFLSPLENEEWRSKDPFARWYQKPASPLLSSPLLSISRKNNHQARLLPPHGAHLDLRPPGLRPLENEGSLPFYSSCADPVQDCRPKLEFLFLGGVGT